VLFAVYNNNVLRGSYLIDPKLKVNS
jgi:hypothetical protein